MKKFFINIWSALNKVSSYGIITIFISIFLWFITPFNKFEKGLIIFIFLLLFLIAALLRVAYTYYKEASKNRMPKVICTFSNGGNSIINNTKFLLEPSEIFSYDSLVSFYYKDEDNFELLIGLGIVTNIQQDKKIQVTILEFLKEHIEILNKIKTNKANALKRIIVKPNVPKMFLNKINGGFNE